MYLACGSSAWGMGHLRRSGEVIRVLRRNGLNLDSVAWLPEQGTFKEDPLFLSNFNKRVSALGELYPGKYNGLIVDVHTAAQVTVNKWVAGTGVPIAALDWYSERPEKMICALNLRDNSEGLKYAIVREEFHSAAEGGKHFGYDIVAVLGGGDQRGAGPRLLESFQSDSRFLKRTIAIICGPLTKWTIPGGVRGRIKVLTNPPDICNLMAGARVGISNAGTSLMEFSFLGVPTVVFPQTIEEDSFARLFIENGSSVSGNWEGNRWMDELDHLLSDEILREIRSKKARLLVDGKGVDRIVESIMSAMC